MNHPLFRAIAASRTTNARYRFAKAVFIIGEFYIILATGCFDVGFHRCHRQIAVVIPDILSEILGIYVISRVQNAWVHWEVLGRLDSTFDIDDWLLSSFRAWNASHRIRSRRHSFHRVVEHSWAAH